MSYLFMCLDQFQIHPSLTLYHFNKVYSRPVVAAQCYSLVCTQTTQLLNSSSIKIIYSQMNFLSHVITFNLHSELRASRVWICLEVEFG